MKKGFTLIELLAVIVILAIIALIATPIILGIINDAKEDSNKRSVENYAHAVELAVARYAAGNGGVVPVGEYTINGKFIEQGSTKIEIDYKGEEIKGTVNVDAKGKISLSEVQFAGEGKKYFYTEESGVTTDGESSGGDIEDDDLSSIILDNGHLLYYEATGDVVLPSTIKGTAVKTIGAKAFVKTNIIQIGYEPCYETNTCDYKFFIFVLDPSKEEEVRSLTGNREGFEIIVPETNADIVEKYNYVIDQGYTNFAFVTGWFENGNMDMQNVINEGITSIDLSNVSSLEEVENDAFRNLTNLKQVKLPASLQKIDAAFYGNTNLEEIVVPFASGSIPNTWKSDWNYDEKLAKSHTIKYNG